MVKRLLAISIFLFSLTTLGYLSINADAIQRAGQAKAEQRIARARATTQFLESFYDGLASFVDGLFLVLILALIVAVICAIVLVARSVYERHWRMKHTAQDGVFPLIDQTLRLPDGTKATLTTNPNLLSVPQTLTIHGGAMAGAYQLPAAHLSTGAQLEVMRIGRTANNLRAMPQQGRVTGGLFNAMNHAPRLPRFEDEPEEMEEGAEATVEPMTISQAYQQSTPESWIVGRSTDGQLATFNPKTDVHFAILGATGSGKSASVGLMTVGHALRLGWRVLVLDGKGGDDWSPLASHVEYHEADSISFPGQVARLVQEFEQRRNGKEIHPLLVMIEEYGDINYGMSRSEGNAANEGLIRIIRQGRDVRMHLGFIDQYPNRWEPQLLANTKAKFVFSLADGAIVKEYHVHQLATCGEFFFRGKRYNSFDLRPHVERLRQVAAPRSYPMLIDGEAEPVQEKMFTGKHSGAGKWDELIEQYVQQNPGALAGERGHVAELARRMAARDGAGKPFENYKGEASEGLNRLRSLSVDVSRGE